jgi:hypothetical protein
MDHCCISVEQVYGKPNPVIPEGYKKIDFRPFRVGDFVLLTYAPGVVSKEIEKGENSYGRPYIILEKLPPKPEVIEQQYYTYNPPPKTLGLWHVYATYTVSIPAGYKFLTFRPPTSGEYFLTVDFTVEKACEGSHGKDSPRIILLKN